MEQARENMFKQQLRPSRHISDELAVLMSSIDRAHYLPAVYQSLAYAETSIPLGDGEFTLPPVEEAEMIQALNVQPGDKVLQLGAAGGYTTAVLAALGGDVTVVDSIDAQVQWAKRKLEEARVKNVRLITGNTNEDWQASAPFDVIVVTGSLPHLPESLCKGLTINGRLFAIVGEKPVMRGTLITRTGEAQWTHRVLFETERARLADAKPADPFKF